MLSSFMEPWINGAAHFNIRTTLSCLLALLCGHALVINDNNMSCLLLGNIGFEHNPLDFILYIIMHLSIFALLSPSGDRKILHLLLFLDAMAWPFLVTRIFCICSILAFFEFFLPFLDAMSSSWFELAISLFFPVPCDFLTFIPRQRAFPFLILPPSQITRHWNGCIYI